MEAVSRIRCNPYMENGQAISAMTIATHHVQIIQLGQDDDERALF
ncbi:hypothetical protein WDV93_01580 [Pantoea ananatis]